MSSQVRGDEGRIPLSFSLMLDQEEGVVDDDTDSVSVLPMAIANHSISL